MAGRSKHRHVRSSLRAILSAWRPALNLALAAGLLAESSGCTRRYYREDADKEVGEILAQKDKYPDWKIENWWVYPDPRSRFADPTNPDRPPKPPDDPAAYALAPNPQKPGHAGVERLEGNGYLDLIAQWDRENRERRAKQEAAEKPSIEPPVSGGPEGGQEEQEAEADPQAPASGEQQPPVPGAAPGSMPAAGADPYPITAIPSQRDAIAEAKERSTLDISGRPAYLLSLDQAAELAMFNSRQYQDQREDLYLAALPVALERFSFMAQFLAGSQAIRSYAASEAPGGKENNWALNNGIGMSKVLPTGALLLLNFSNQTVFNFLNPKKVVSVTALDFSAIQPLLQGGGKAVALESLTTAERNLLYQIRAYARFRKELYVLIASNNGGAINGANFQPTGVVSSNNIISVGGLGGPAGPTPGVIPAFASTLTAPIVPPASPGFIQATGAITPTPSGYLNTMLEKITVYIDQENIDVLSDILQRFRGLLEGDLVGPLQVQNVEQQLLTGRSTLLADQQNYLQSLDAFKLEIGVPTTLSIEMDDTELQPLIKQYRRARAIIEDERAGLAEASALIPIEKAPQLRAALLRLYQTSPLSRGTPFARTIGQLLAEWEKLSDKDLADRLQALQKESQQLLDKQAELLKKDQALTPAEQARLRSLASQIDMGNLERLLRQYLAAYVVGGKPNKPAPADERKRITQFQGVISAWQKVLVLARDDRWAAVRSSWPELPRVCVDGVDLIKDDLTTAQKTADTHALLNRLDLMNTRAQVVDAWRQLAVYANALLGTFTVQYNLSASSPVGAAQPLNVGGSATTNQLVLNASPPLARIEQRNNYRTAQIALQRQRRQLQQAEDLAEQAVNVELTNLRQFAEQYKLQQRQLELAYLTIDSSLESLQAPVAPAVPAGLTRTQADGPAALTQQLLAAQRSLPAAQSALLTIWINYLDQRLQLYRDLELMPLDARGVWIDKIKECECPTTEAPAAGPAVPATDMLPPPTRTGPPSDQEGK
jgi:hypothetical protein